MNNSFFFLRLLTGGETTSVGSETTGGETTFVGAKRPRAWGRNDGAKRLGGRHTCNGALLGDNGLSLSIMGKLTKVLVERAHAHLALASLGHGHHLVEEL